MAVRATGLAAIGLIALNVVSCSSRKQPPPPVAPPPVTLPDTKPQSAADYMKLASSNALLVVRASELAAKRSSNSDVRQLADRLRREHHGIAGQLNMAGRRINLLPQAHPLLLDKVMLDRLTQVPDFDLAYLRTMRAAIDECVSVHQQYALDGSSATLRPVARFAASTCIDELAAVPRR